MKFSKRAVHRKTHRIPVLRFEDQQLTSFSGLVLYQRLFAALQLKSRLKGCFRGASEGAIFGPGTVMLMLVVHLLLGYRELRDSRFYRDDPMVKRLLGLTSLPDVATVSRTLAGLDATSVAKVRALSRSVVLERLQALNLARVTLDFDGSVQSTRRAAEGTAVGFNKKRKGARSYYPLFCTIPQTGQVLDVHHRPGNVHDTNGAEAYIIQCVRAVRAVLPANARIEARLDAAFFSDAIVSRLHELGVEFTLSVPFARFAALKGLIEARRRWRRWSGELCYFEMPWKPNSWAGRYRFVFLRRQVKQQRKGPLQLDLFAPHRYGYEFKVIVTNKTVRMKNVLAFHEGRGSQEATFAELKSHCQLDYVPVRRLAGNQAYLLAGLLAHNLSRELHMRSYARDRNTTEKRAALWAFRRLDTVRRTLVQRAGRLTKPKGALTLTMSANRAVRDELLHCLAALQPAA